MSSNRAEDRKFHFTYKVTCSYNGRVFYGLHSTDELDDSSFSGKGTALNESKKDYGLEAHKLERIQIYPSRIEAKTAYNELKASELVNPCRPEDRKFHYVYKTTRFDGKFYIGIHSTDDLEDGYKGSGTHIIRSLKKHGKDKHALEILKLCDSRNDAFDLEETLVTEETLRDPLCMNKIKGGRQHGNRVYGVTEETRQKLSKHFKTVERTPEWKAKIGAAHRGKTMPREAVERQRAKMTGYKWSEEQVQKRTIGQLNSEKFKERYRPIIIDGVTYQNGREAVTALGIPGGTIANRLKSPNWLNYRYADQPEKDPALVSKRARGEYTRD